MEVKDYMKFQKGLSQGMLNFWGFKKHTNYRTSSIIVFNNKTSLLNKKLFYGLYSLRFLFKIKIIF